MKANELRIGNLIDRQDYICKVTKIEEGGIITEPLEYKGEMFVKQGVEPIPLTEEWLVKFGFKKGSKGWFKTYSHKTEVSVITCKFNFYMYKHICNYVHQLQNLYFALTGEELTIG